MPRPSKAARELDFSHLFSAELIDRSRSIGPQIYELMRLNIILDKLPSGTQINESDIGSWFGVSRTPIREAFQKLIGDGLVVGRPQVGSVVAPIDEARVTEGVIIRRALEREVVKLICLNETELASLEPIIALQSVAVSQSNHIDFFKVDEQFHAQLAELAEIPSAWRLAQSVKAHTDQARIRLTSNIPQRINLAFQEHLSLIDALKAHDIEMSQALISKHINSVFEALGTYDAGMV